MSVTTNAINMYILPTKIVSTWIILGLVCTCIMACGKKKQQSNNGTSNKNVVAIGYNAVATNYGVAIGYDAVATNYGVVKNLIIHHKESFYQQKFSEYINGKRERSIPLGRIDVETSNVVFEVEFLNKFKEAIGQSKWYSWQTGKRPGIVFVVRKDQVEKCKQVLDMITNKSGIVVFVMDLDGNVLP